jgi:hypothetical protein
MRVNHPRGIPMGLTADAGLVPSADVGRNRLVVKVTRQALDHWRAMPAAAWEQDPKRRKFPGGGTPARGRQPGRTSEPAHPETAGRTSQDPASTTRATKPDQKSWDFDESEQDFGEKENPPKPHANP